jgi:hypothetical protein
MGGRLQHQFDGLADCHEISPDFRMGDSDWPSGGDLRLKQWQYAAVAAQNVPETYCDETG